MMPQNEIFHEGISVMEVWETYLIFPLLFPSFLFPLVSPREAVCIDTYKAAPESLLRECHRSWVLFFSCWKHIFYVGLDSASLQIFLETPTQPQIQVIPS